MPVRAIVKQLDNAFVKEESKLPPFVEKVLNGVEAWLNLEKTEIESSIGFKAKAELQSRKSSLFLASLSKKVDYCALIHRSQGDRGLIQQEYFQGLPLKSERLALSLPPIDLNRQYRVSAEKLPLDASFREYFQGVDAHLLFIDPDHALLILSKLPAEKKHALLQRVTLSLKSIRG